MKKRLLSTFAAGFLAAALVPAMAFATPAEEGVAATDSAESVLAVSDSAAGASQEVQDVYDAYTSLHSALNSQDIVELQAAADGFEDVVDTFDDLAQDQDQLAELAELLGETPENAFWVVFSDWIDTNVVLNTYKIYQDYLYDKNVKTALDFSDQYDRLAEGDGHLDLVRGFIPDFDAVYSDVLNHMASPEVMSVYDAYIDLKNALDSYTMSELQAAAEGFEAVVETFDELAKNQDQLGELAELLGETLEDAFGKIFSDWVDANVILTTEELYQAYLADPNAETAAEFVAMYDAIYNDPAYEDEQLRMRLSWFIFDIDDVYADALALVSPDSGEDEEGDQSKSGLAQAGDGLTVASLAGLMTVCFGGLAACIFALRRKSAF